MEENNKKTNEVYTNALTVSNTFFDFNISFKKEYIYEDNGQQKKDSEEVALIRMSPQMAKALMSLLQNNVAQYEKEYGTIPGFKTE